MPSVGDRQAIDGTFRENSIPTKSLHWAESWRNPTETDDYDKLDVRTPHRNHDFLSGRWGCRTKSNTACIRSARTRAHCRLVVRAPLLRLCQGIAARCTSLLSKTRYRSRSTDRTSPHCSNPPHTLPHALARTLRTLRAGDSIASKSTSALGGSPGRAPRWAVGVAGYLDSAQPDAVLAMQVIGVVAATMAMHLTLRPVRLVATAHNRFDKRRLIRRGRRAYPLANVAIGVSQGVSNDLAGIIKVPIDRVHAIYNPVVTDELLLKSKDVCEHPWLKDSGPPVILAIGRLSKAKDFPTLLRAFARLSIGRSLRLIVLGKGKLLNKLLALARDLGISDRVHFAGFVANPYAFLARATLFVLSSRREGLPTVLIEALACGCPVVSTDG